MLFSLGHCTSSYMLQCKEFLLLKNKEEHEGMPSNDIQASLFRILEASFLPSTMSLLRAFGSSRLQQIAYRYL